MNPPQTSADFYDRETLANPFPLMAEFRTHAPVMRTVDPAGRTIFVVTDMVIIEQIAKRTDAFSNDFGHLFVAGNNHPEVAEILEQAPLRATLLLGSDAPDHTRYRSLVNAVFATGRVSHLTPVIEALTDTLIDGFIEKGRCNFVDEFAVLLPTYIIADILGLPRDKYDKVKKWSDAVVTIVGRTGTKEDEIHAAHDIVDFRRYLHETVAARRVEPQDDLISNLVCVQVDGVQPFDDIEAAALAFEIAVAGNETTRNTLMSGLVQLLRHPDQMQALIDDPSLFDNAVEEILRYETPASSMWRIAREDMTLAGTDIPAGSTLLLRYDGGNRDPKRFEDPDRFDIRRKNARTHIAFGAPSVHRCLGQMLARKELVIGFRQLLKRLHNIEIVDGSDTSYQPSLLFHTIGSLEITFDPAERVHR
ncbi:cytochrome P450 [Sphingomonas aliaeris]|uniref:Cytochrome P450 n=1 Tax=Sphingomonas aliaeris TaxID=2759526 RepID=A0A974S534_9SPHN|nr:cytochrome P450 [Sphingomonas aliaeris]QQV77650.1 cytochrome P450 [Sphingomonas aliaeris]